MIAAALKGMALVRFRGQPDSDDDVRHVELMLRLRELALAEQAWGREQPPTTDSMLDTYRTAYRSAMVRLEVQAGLLMAEHPDSRVPKELDEFLEAWKDWSLL